MSASGFNERSMLTGFSVKLAAGKASRYEPAEPKRHQAEAQVSEDQVPQEEIEEITDRAREERTPTWDISL